jgi:hypothetical protein
LALLQRSQAAATANLSAVMPGHSRSKNGVASLAYVPGIHDLATQDKAWMAGTMPGHDELRERN